MNAFEGCRLEKRNGWIAREGKINVKNLSSTLNTDDQKQLKVCSMHAHAQHGLIQDQVLFSIKSIVSVNFRNSRDRKSTTAVGNPRASHPLNNVCSAVSLG